MNKFLIYIVITFFIFSCNSPYKMIKFRGKNKEVLKLNIPKNYIFEGLQAGRKLEHRYWYTDSIVLYVTTFENTLNYNQIRAEGKYYERFEALRSGDTIILSGYNSKSLYWKDKLLKNGITIGYKNVPVKKLNKFDSLVNSFE